MNSTLVTARTGLAYASASLGQRAIAFLLLPLYSRFLSPGEFGQISMLVTLYSVIGIVLSFGLEASVFRAYFKHQDPMTRSRSLGAIGAFLLTVPTGTVLLVAAALVVADAQPLDLPRSALLIELFAGAWFATLTTFPLALLRAQERVRAYIWLNVGFAAIQTVTRLVLVLGLGRGVQGWVIADLAAVAIVLPLGILSVRTVAPLVWDRSRLREALEVGVPLMPHFLSHWALALSDRLIVGALLGSALVGIYGMGYAIGSLVGLVLTEANRAAMPTYARLLTEDGSRQAGAISRLATHQLLFSILVGLGMAALGPCVVLLLLDPSYSRAAELIPPVSVGLVLFGFYFIPMNLISLVAGKTRWVWILTLSAGLLNVILNLILVRPFGIQMAAYNSVIGYAALLGLVILYQRRVAGKLIAPDIQRVVISAGGGLVAWLLISRLSDPAQVSEAALRLPALLLVGVLLFAPEIKEWMQRDARDAR